MNVESLVGAVVDSSGALGGIETIVKHVLWMRGQVPSQIQEITGFLKSEVDTLPEHLSARCGQLMKKARKSMTQYEHLFEELEQTMSLFHVSHVMVSIGNNIHSPEECYVFEPDYLPTFYIDQAGLTSAPANSVGRRALFSVIQALDLSKRPPAPGSKMHLTVIIDPYRTALLHSLKQIKTSSITPMASPSSTRGQDTSLSFGGSFAGDPPPSESGVSTSGFTAALTGVATDGDGDWDVYEDCEEDEPAVTPPQAAPDVLMGSPVNPLLRAPANAAGAANNGSSQACLSPPPSPGVFNGSPEAIKRVVESVMDRLPDLLPPTARVLAQVKAKGRKVPTKGVKTVVRKSQTVQIPTMKSVVAPPHKVRLIMQRDRDEIYAEVLAKVLHNDVQLVQRLTTEIEQAVSRSTTTLQPFPACQITSEWLLKDGLLPPSPAPTASWAVNLMGGAKTPFKGWKGKFDVQRIKKLRARADREAAQAREHNAQGDVGAGAMLDGLTDNGTEAWCDEED